MLRAESPYVEPIIESIIEKEENLSERKLSVGSSIAESYRFFTGHLPHFFRLIYGPLVLWVMIRLMERVLLREQGVAFESSYYLNIVTAAFAIIWYRQFLLGAEYASYLGLIRRGFNGNGFSLRSFGRTFLRIVVISLALLVPTLIVSMAMMVYYQGQGVHLSSAVINELAVKSTFVVMLAFSPVLARLSLFTAGLALGRSSLRFRDVWQKTRGYTATLWWVALRGFLPLSIYNFILTWLLRQLADKLAIHYVVSTIFIETIAGLLTFMMLAIVVAANAEAFRVLIGVREGDAPHRADSGRRRRPDPAVKTEEPTPQQAK